MRVVVRLNSKSRVKQRAMNQLLCILMTDHESSIVKLVDEQLANRTHSHTHHIITMIREYIPNPFTDALVCILNLNHNSKRSYFGAM